MSATCVSLLPNHRPPVGIKLWLFAFLLQVRSDVNADTKLVRWSLLRGLIPLPFSSPTESTSDNDIMVRSIIFDWTGKRVARYTILRVVDAQGKRTGHYATMRKLIGATAFLKPRSKL